MSLARLFLFALVIASTGCTAPVGAGTLAVPKDGAVVCADQCAQIGMRLSAVAIMAGHVGCVCQPASGAQAADGAAPAGMATIAMLESERRRQQQQQQRQQQQQHR